MLMTRYIGLTINQTHWRQFWYQKNLSIEVSQMNKIQPQRLPKDFPQSHGQLDTEPEKLLWVSGHRAGRSSHRRGSQSHSLCLESMAAVSVNIPHSSTKKDRMGFPLLQQRCVLYTFVFFCTKDGWCGCDKALWWRHKHLSFRGSADWKEAEASSEKKDPKGQRSEVVDFQWK